jgi:lipopolysaccharide transport system ATP-binding protein
LLKILSRVTTQSSGQIKVKGRIASLLEVGTGFHPELTGRENIFLNGAILGMRKAEIARKFDEIVEFSGCARYIDTPVKRYSSGMYVRLAFAVAAHLEPEILIVDEVLAVGDAEFQKMPGQNEGCRRPWPHDSLELKKGTSVFSRGEFRIDKR